MSRMSVRAVVAAAGAAVCLAAAGARAQQSRSWTSPVSGNWAVDASWTPSGFPNNSGPNTFNAFIAVTGAAYTVTLDQDITINDLSVTSADATLELGNFNLVMNGNYTQSRGLLADLTGTGSIRTSGTVTLGDTMVDGVHSFFSQGTLIFNSTLECDICDTGIGHSGNSCLWQSGDIMMDEGATFLNGASSTMTIGTAGRLYWNNVGTQPAFNNQGTIKRTGVAGTTMVTGVTLNNTGTVQVESGTLRADTVAQVSAGALTGGTWNVFGGSTLDLVGAAITTNAADVTLRDAGSQFPAIDGLQTNAAAGRLTLGAGRNFTTQGNFTNSGALNVGASTAFRVAPGQSLTNYNAGTRTLTGGTYSVGAGGAIRFDGADVRTLAADVTLSGAGSDITDPVLNQSGLRNLGTVAGAGALSVQSGRNFLTAGNFTVAPGGRLAIGAGTLFRVQPGFTMTNFSTGVFTDGGFTIAGVLQFDGAAIQTVNNGVVLDGAGDHIINENGQSAFTQLTSIQNQGDVSVSGGHALSIPGMNLSGRLGINGATSSVTVSGNFTQAPSGTLDFGSGGQLNVSGTLNLGGTVSGTGTINGNPVINGTLTPGHSAGRITIAGGLILAGSAEIDVQLGGLQPGAGYDQLVLLDTPTALGRLSIAPGSNTLLSVSLIDGFAPVFGEHFDVALFSSMTGEFGRINGLDVGGGTRLEVEYLPDRIRLLVVPAPASAAALGLAGLLVSRRRRASGARIRV